MIPNYEEAVYAGLLGKVIGVYMGRPFEGWSKAALEERWGMVDRYVHEDLEKDLVVSDDDISGTITFLRALEDSGVYAETPPEFYGDTWLNYLIENSTVLWWGGMGMSTEHTAFIRLRAGVKAPRSGSIGLNGRTVAEQIGAQIFIDGFGLVAPGRPDLAADLARRSASVSHDGEAVLAAVVVAAMVSAAFVEKDMARIIETGLDQIPADSLIARIHKDVAEWAASDGDWRKTFERIDKVYGYRCYGGNCHVVPNHAVMAMAWRYAPDSFHMSQTIVNTAGWDTDCNAANVGSVMGVKLGLAAINSEYDFQSPFADRLLVPTAEGTRSVTDVLTEALHIARIGRKVMGWDDVPAPKNGAWHHFSMPGGLHGYMADDADFETRGRASVTNANGRMHIAFRTCLNGPARVSTPLLPKEEIRGSYNVVASPRLYPGMTVEVEGVAGEIAGGARACIALAAADSTEGPKVALASGKPFRLSCELPDLGDGLPFRELGIKIESETAARGEILVDAVRYGGTPRVSWPEVLPVSAGKVSGWIKDADAVRGPFPHGPIAETMLGKNSSRGILVTGTTDWCDYDFEASVSIHLADLGGIIAHYQGLERYIALVQAGGKLKLIRRYYGEEVLGEHTMSWAPGEPHRLKLVMRGTRIQAWCDGKMIIEAGDDLLHSGGAGFVFDRGLVGVSGISIGWGLRAYDGSSSSATARGSVVTATASHIPPNR